MGRESSVGWAREFYTQQAALFGLYELPLDIDALSSWHQRRAEAVERLAGGRSLRILELGCGTGNTAAMLASRGHYVVAVDIVDQLAQRVRAWAEHVEHDRLRALHADFLEIDLPERFDAVCYFDGFGVGADAEQRRLLHRIARWLTLEGCALIDVLTPWYWFTKSGSTYRSEQIEERFDFDVEASRMINWIWPVGNESQAVMQSLRCYSPADFRLLLEGTGLELSLVEGYESEQYARRVPMNEAMLYLARLTTDRG